MASRSISVPRAPAPRVAAAVCLGLALLGGCALFEKPTCPAKKYEPPDERFVFFGVGRTDIPADGYFGIGFVAAQLDVDAAMHVLVVGHADGTGGRGDVNREMSFRRARAVRKVLLEHGVQEKRILIAVPKEQTETTSSQLARRVDLYVYDPIQDEASKRLGYTVDVRSE